MPIVAPIEDVSKPPPGAWRVAVEVGHRGIAWVDGHDVQAIAFVDPARGQASPDSLAGRWFDLAARHAQCRPPVSFDDAETFGAWLARRQHAGALAVMQPRLWLDEDAEPCGVTLSVLDPVWGAGFTPDGEHRAGGPLDAPPRVRVDAFPGGMRLVHWQRFDLRDPTSLHGRFDPDHPAPWGWLRVTYDLRSDGTSRAFIASSYVPTSWFYRDGLRVHRADPRDRDAGEIAATLASLETVPTGSTWSTVDCSTGLVHVVREDAS